MPAELSEELLDSEFDWEQINFDGQSGNQFIVFRLGKHQFGTPILSIKEIIEDRPCSHVPNTVENFLGVINIRGQIVGVVDLAPRLKVKTQASETSRALVIFETEVGLIAARVDEVLSVSNIAEDNIEANPNVTTHVPPKYLIGIAKHKENIVSLIDLEKLLSSQELISLKNSKIASY